VLDTDDGLPAGLLGIERTLDGEAFVTLAEMSGQDAVLDPRWSRGWQVAIDSVGAGPREGTAFDGTVAADQALVLRRS
jgi:hypothetical protein